jgi:uncharacterized membrane protein YdjX (TVP38/TMEM64 family)
MSELDHHTAVAREHAADGNSSPRTRWIGVAWWIVLAALLVTARVQGWLTPEDFEHAMRWSGDRVWLTIPVVIVAFVIGGMLLIPANVMIASLGALLGTWSGLGHGLLGVVVGSTIFHGIGRVGGASLVDQLAGPRVRARIAALARRGFFAVLLLRLVPIVPHAVVGIAAGATRIGLAPFLAATGLVMVPAAVLMAALGHELTSEREHGWLMPAAIAAGLAIIAVATLAARRILRAKADPPPSDPAP